MDLFVVINAADSMKCEDDLLTLFESVNVRTGNLNPCVIKAWFDTDCSHLLQWLCSSITVDNYVSAQQESEYSQLDEVLTHEELSKKLTHFQCEFPELLDIEMNLFHIETANDTIEMLEEELRNYNHQLQLNEKLLQRLSVELSLRSSEEIKLNVEYEKTLESCTQFGNHLDDTNKKTFEQVAKYSFYLSNFESGHMHKFANNTDITPFEEQFSDVVHSLNSLTSVDDNLLEMSNIKNLHFSLSHLQERIFQSKINNLTVCMEIEALKNVQKFLNGCTSDAFYRIDLESVQANVDLSNKQQQCLLKMIEEAYFKAVEQDMKQFTVKYYKNELDFYLSRVNYLHKFNKYLEQILQHFVVIYNLYLQEKMDLSDSKQFFINIHNNVKRNIEDCRFRKVAMLQTVKHFEKFVLEPIEIKFKLISDFGTIPFSGSKSLAKTVKEKAIMELKTKTLRKEFMSVDEFATASRKLKCNVEVSQNFLSNGPTHQIVVVPHKLQLILLRMNENLSNQSSAIKSSLKLTKSAKDKLAENKWLRVQHKLWTLYLTDQKRMSLFFNEVHSEPKRFF